MTADDDHLRLLSFGHFVVAGLAALVALFPVIHLVVGVRMVTGTLPEDSRNADLRIFGWMFIFIASAIIICGLAFAACLAMAGRCLARRSHYTFCLVMAALACGFVPLGTVLGVFTILVLQRRTVKQMFGQAVTDPPPVPA
jgi:hypothetical protein